MRRDEDTILARRSRRRQAARRPEPARLSVGLFDAPAGAEAGARLDRVLARIAGCTGPPVPAQLECLSPPAACFLIVHVRVMEMPGPVPFLIQCFIR